MEIYNLKEKLEYLDEVIELEHDEWGEEPDKDRETRLNNKRNKVLKNLSNNDFCKLVLLSDNILVGFISIFPHDSEEYPELTPWYATMYVKKEYRGNGYSRILNDAILKEAKNRGFNTIYLKSELNNYYEKFGAKYIENISDTEKLFKFDL